MRRFAEALAEAKYADNFDPLSPVHLGFEGSIYNYIGDHDKALQLWETAAEVSPNSSGAYFYQGLAYLYKGMPEDAVRVARTAEKLAANEPRSLANAAYLYGRAGRRVEAQRVLKQLNALAKTTEVPSGSLAYVHAGLQDNDRAFALLEEAYKKRESALTGLQIYPTFDPLRSDPRFQDLLRRMNFPLTLPDTVKSQ